MRRLASERGVSLVEYMVAMTISFVVFAATLTVIESMTRQKSLADTQNDHQQIVRTTLDRLASELRNMASPTDLTSTSSTLPRAIDRNGAFDLIFRTVRQEAAGSATDANVQRVRYCLGDDGNMRRMEEPVAAEVAPTTAACNDASPGWSNIRIVGQSITNAYGTRPVFTYSGDSGSITATDSVSRSNISRVSAELFVDADRTRRPVETKLSTGVMLRNQNREPRAVFTATVISPGPANREVLLNGSGSDDPESQQLDYHWYEDDIKIGEGIVFTHRPTNSGIKRYRLKVYDPADLEGVSEEQSIKFN